MLRLDPSTHMSYKGSDKMLSTAYSRAQGAMEYFTALRMAYTLTLRGQSGPFPWLELDSLIYHVPDLHLDCVLRPLEAPIDSPRLNLWGRGILWMASYSYYRTSDNL